MRRRDFLATLGGGAVYSGVARAQSTPPATIGLLYAGTFTTYPNAINPDALSYLRKGLADQGYIEGTNLRIEYRQAHNNMDILGELARDLVRQHVRVIVAPGSMPAALAAKAATSTIPIVFGNAGDPIQSGLVTSLSRPGGNATGFTDIGAVLLAKRLEFLKLLVPAARVAGILVTQNNRNFERELPSARDGARSLGLELSLVQVSTEPDIDSAFEGFVQKRAEVVCVIPHSLFFDHRERVVALAARHRLPTIYPLLQFVEAGGLISYGSSILDRAYQMGVYTGRILKGADPADLPVGRPTKFELAINAKVAAALGLDVPAPLLALVDRVIA
jgi:putative ABC transport system substrate-binding protein